MKKLACVSLFALITAFAVAADAVQPATLGLQFYRGAVPVMTITNSYYTGTTILLTNSVAFVGGLGTATQGLGGVTVEVRIGSTRSNTAYYATADASSNFWCSMVAPSYLTSAENCLIQIKLTDSASNSFIYPAAPIVLATPLH